MPLYRIRTVFSGVAGTPWYSNLYFDSAGGTQSQAHAAVAAFWLAAKPQIMGGVTWQVQGDIALIDTFSGNILNVLAVPAVNDAGSSAGDPLPYQTQGLLTLNSGVYLAGRSVRGRLFLPAPSEGASILGRPVAAYTALFTGAATTMINDPGSTWVVWSRKNGLAPIVTTATMKAAWAVLRSRRD